MADTPITAVALIPNGFRELKEGDVIQEGDVLLPFGATTWKQAVKCIGAKYKQNEILRPQTIVSRKFYLPAWKPEMFSMYVVGGGASAEKRNKIDSLRRQFFPTYLYSGNSGKDFYILYQYKGRDQCDFYGGPHDRETCFRGAKILSFDEFVLHFMSPHERKRCFELTLGIDLTERPI